MLPNDDVRYVIADFHYNVPDGQRSDIVFISWAPEHASIKKRMLVASSTEALKGILIGCKTSVQACSYSELEMRNVAEKFKGTI
jgi:cofilin